MSEVLTGLSANPQPLTIKAQSGICLQTKNWGKNLRWAKGFHGTGMASGGDLICCCLHQLELTTKLPVIQTIITFKQTHYSKLYMST